MKSFDEQLILTIHSICAELAAEHTELLFATDVRYDFQIAHDCVYVTLRAFKRDAAVLFCDYSVVYTNNTIACVTYKFLVSTLLMTSEPRAALKYELQKLFRELEVHLLGK